MFLGGSFCILFCVSFRLRIELVISVLEKKRNNCKQVVARNDFLQCIFVAFSSRSYMLNVCRLLCCCRVAPVSHASYCAA